MILTVLVTFGLLTCTFYIYVLFQWIPDAKGNGAASSPITRQGDTAPTAPLVENICGTPGAFVPGFTPDLKKIEKPDQSFDPREILVSRPGSRI